MRMVPAVRRYYLYRATLSPGFYVPVSVAYLQARGLGLAAIGAVEGAFLFGTVVAELPTGFLGDRLGRRTALALGNVVLVGVMGGLVVADTAVEFLVVYVVWSVGWTFRTGTADAWLYELLSARGLADDHARASGRADSILRVVSGGAALSAGLLYAVDPRLPFVATAVLAALGLPVLATIPDPGRVDSGPETGAGGPASDHGHADRGGCGGSVGVGRAARALGEHLPRPSIRWLVAYAALFNVVFAVTRVFEQPAMRSVGVPVAAFGAVYAGFKLTSAVAASAAGPLRDRLGTRGVLVSLVPVVGLAYAGLGALPVFVLPALFARRAVQRLTRPVRTQYLNDRIDGTGRATVLSGVSMVLGLVSAGATVASGWLAAAVGPLAVVSGVGVVASVVGGLVWLTVRPVRAGTSGPTPG